MSSRILIVDDDDDIRELFSSYLEGFGYSTQTAEDGAAMRRLLATSSFDLVLLDQRLPGEDGLMIARELRASSDIGIIIITGFGQSVDRIVGLELGADDYVAKPVDLRELLARIRSVLRRRSTVSPAKPAPSLARAYGFDGWTVEPGARRLKDPDGKPVELTTGEFDLLLAFIEQPNTVLTRDQLMNRLHHRDAGPFDRAIDVQVGRLRRKIDRPGDSTSLIRSVRGMGYLFSPKVNPR
jgi:two-component system OmpR family response regulator